MYVRAAARGTGLARQLVEAVLDHAKDRAELIQLSVVSGNISARRLYASLGFEPYGIEEHSLKVAGRYLDEVLMVRLLV
jgi:RimJ/RimL family protein N-acetyltransferase